MDAARACSGRLAGCTVGAGKDRLQPVLDPLMFARTHLVPPPLILSALQSGLVLVGLFAASRECVSQIDAIEPDLRIELQRLALRLVPHFC